MFGRRLRVRVNPKSFTELFDIFKWVLLTESVQIIETLERQQVITQHLGILRTSPIKESPMTPNR